MFGFCSHADINTGNYCLQDDSLFAYHNFPACHVSVPVCCYIWPWLSEPCGVVAYTCFTRLFPLRVLIKLDSFISDLFVFSFLTLMHCDGSLSVK